jgi:hypothetical protein
MVTEFYCLLKNKQMQQKFLFIVCLLLSSFYSPAQVPSLNPNNGIVPAVMNSGGYSYDAPSDYYRFEGSFGEMLLVQALSPADSSVLLTQGVLQPCTDQLKGTLTLLFEKGDYKLFPNPTKGKFEVDFFVKTPGRMTLQLMNATGEVLSTKSYYYDGCCRIELFDLTRYPDGVYFVVADLKPDELRQPDQIRVIRHSGFKVIKLSDQ